jgi:uncharacterized protein
VPVVESSFQPPWWLRDGHAQTIAAALLRRRAELRWTRDRLELEDGDFLDLDWLRPGHPRVAILLHGLEGSASAGYVRGMAAALAEDGWDVLAWSFRGCGGEPNRLPRFYHSGETQDLAAVVRHTAPLYREAALVGFSLGGNVALKYLGESPHPIVRAAAAISAPVDLASSARKLDESRGNRIYLRRFLRTLVAKVEAKAQRFPEELDAAGARAIRSFRDFDDRFTAALHGFRDAADYWARSSARPLLPRIRVPALLLNARDDPFLAPDSFPVPEAQASSCFFLEAPEHGGHVGFLDLRRGIQPWWERRVTEFFRHVRGGT